MSESSPDTQSTLRLNPDDNVVIARRSLSPGMAIQAEGMTVKEPVGPGHKLAVQAIVTDQPALIGALFFSRAIALVRGVRQARKEGEEIRGPLLRDAGDR